MEHKCIVNLYDTDVDMESDISSLQDSEAENEEGSSNDESDNENETDESENETDRSEIEDDNDMSDDEADVFQSTNCCIHELIDPFFQAMIETKQTDVIRE